MQTHTEIARALLDESSARQILHLTFGSALAVFGAPLREPFEAHQEEYAQKPLDQHFCWHLKPFVGLSRK